MTQPLEGTFWLGYFLWESHAIHNKLAHSIIFLTSPIQYTKWESIMDDACELLLHG